MRKSLVWLTLLASVGCEQDYKISETSGLFGVDNPAALETPEMTDRIVQVTTPEVDVLFAIDNSCSMEEEQEALVTAFPTFMHYFIGSGLNYHVGVISTDVDDPTHSGKLRESRGLRYIDPDTDEPTDVFEDMARMGISGSGYEKGREAAYTAIELKKNTYNEGFIRDMASLHIVIISDEDDSSTVNPIGRSEFAEYLLDLKIIPGNVTFSSIVNPEGCCGGMVDEQPGTNYLWVTRNVGGIEWDIRSDTWDDVLDLLGIQASGLKREFFLSQMPVEDSIEVAVRDMEEQIEYTFDEGIDWVYEPQRNSVRFLEFVPDALNEVLITYQVLAAIQEEDVSDDGSDDGGATDTF